MKRKKLRFSLGNYSPLIVVAVVFVAAAALLYGYKLTQLMPAAPGEQYTIQALGSPANLLDNPLLLPYKLTAAILLQLPGDPTRLVRLASVVLSLANIGLFFILARRWYGQLNSLAVTTLFASSGWLLQTGRYGAGYSALILMILGLLNITVWVNSTERSNRAVLLFAAVASLALCVPGGLWFILAASFVCRQALAEHLRETAGKYLALSASFLVAAMALLGLAFARDVSLLQQWLGVPMNMPDLITIGKQAVLSVSGFAVRGPVLPEVWLAHTPLLDVAAIAMVVLGLLFYRRHLGNARTHLLALFIAIGIVLTALNGAPALSYLLPLVYFVLGGGFAYLLHQWKKVFPRNPIAEAAAFSLLGLLILCMASFHLQRYFVAWRYSPSTVQAYRQAPTANPLPYLIQ
jgi:hypothetical protein